MKTKILVSIAMLFTLLMTSSTQDNNKLILGKWCNPYTYESTGEIKGFNFKKGGKCEAINVPVLDLKNWEIKDGKLIITGFRIGKDGTKAEYRTEERIEKLTKDELLVVAQEEDPHVAFRYVRVENVKNMKIEKEE